MTREKKASRTFTISLTSGEDLHGFTIEEIVAAMEAGRLDPDDSVTEDMHSWIRIRGIASDAISSAVERHSERSRSQRAAQSLTGTKGISFRQEFEPTDATPSLTDRLREILWFIRDAFFRIGYLIDPPSRARHFDATASMGTLTYGLQRGNDDRIRLRAAESLITKADRSAVKALMRSLDDPLPAVRRAAVMALANTKDCRAFALVLDKVSDGDASVRVAAVGALSAHDYRHVGDTLAKAAQDSDPDVRVAAIGALSAYDYRHVSDVLAKATQDSDPDVRSAAVSALGRHCDHRAADLLIGALEDSNPTIRREAVEALGRLGVGDGRVVEALIRSLDDSVEVQWQAVDALGRIGGPQAIEALIRVGAGRRGTIRVLSLRWLTVHKDSLPPEVCIHVYDELREERRNCPHVHTTKDGTTQTCLDCGKAWTWTTGGVVHRL